MNRDIEKVVYSSSEISSKLDEIAEKISVDYVDKPLTLVGILKGSYMVLSDLSRKITIPHRVDFMSISSYTNTSSTGTVKIMCDLRDSIHDQHVIIVEDILDSGLTLNYLIELLSARNPLSLECCVLITKPAMIKKPVDVKYSGFDLNPPEFVVGYGLDYNELFRNLDYVGVPTEEAIKKYEKSS